MNENRWRHLNVQSTGQWNIIISINFDWILSIIFWFSLNYTQNIHSNALKTFEIDRSMKSFIVTDLRMLIQRKLWRKRKTHCFQRHLHENLHKSTAFKSFQLSFWMLQMHFQFNKFTVNPFQLIRKRYQRPLLTLIVSGQQAFWPSDRNRKNAISNWHN